MPANDIGQEAQLSEDRRSSSPSAASAVTSSAAEHLSCLRRLLRRDDLARQDVDEALAATARLACEAVGGSAALVALRDPVNDEWRAWTNTGHRLRQNEIPLAASLSVLREVCERGAPVVTTADLPLLERSASARRHDVRHVVAVPLQARDARRRLPPVPGCLYADRRGEAAAFSAEDAELVVDVALLAELTLSLLLPLVRTEARLAGWQHEAAGRRADEESPESSDAAFNRSVLEPLRRAAGAGRVGLLLLGPTGSGKSYLAERFHAMSERRARPFVTLDCGQISSSEALGAELFGFARGSGFAVPREGRAGKAELADTGTLFLDEISSLPLEWQPRLLRLLQSGRYSPLGSAEERSVDVQVVAASNQDLRALVARGAFREDLLFRLGEIVVRLPSLSARPADVAALADRFFAAACRRFRRDDLEGLSDAALAALATHDWSRHGNVRGLEHVIARSVLLAPAGLLTADDLLFDVETTASESARTPPATATVGGVADLLRAKLAEHAGNLARLAVDPEVVAAFGVQGPAVPGSTLRLRLRALGLDEALAAARERATVPLEEICAALREHGSGADAARALGMTRDALSWRLRQAGLSVAAVLREAASPGNR